MGLGVIGWHQQKESLQATKVFSMLSEGGDKILCIFYRKPGDRKQYEEKLGTSAQGWTPARANAERTNRINGQKLTK